MVKAYDTSQLGLRFDLRSYLQTGFKVHFRAVSGEEAELKNIGPEPRGPSI